MPPKTYYPVADLPPIEPATKEGHLYYVRLKTPVGLFYKLGFTTKASVEERLAYSGTGDEQYIDRVLCFLHYKDAFEIETALHAHFRFDVVFPIPNPDMPLFGNGQSELYARAVLQLDGQYTPSQSWDTLVNIRAQRYKKQGMTEEEMRKELNGYRGALDAMEDTRKIAGGRPVGLLVRLYRKIAYFLESDNGRVRLAAEEKARARAQALVAAIKEQTRIEWLRQIQETNAELKALLEE